MGTKPVSLRMSFAFIVAIANIFLSDIVFVGYWSEISNSPILYDMYVFDMYEFMRALHVIVCGEQIVAPPDHFQEHSQHQYQHQYY
jgi:hypothetical protein